LNSAAFPSITGRADVAQAEHRGAVRDDCDGVALDRQPSCVLGVLGDGETDPGHPRRVGAREVVAVLERNRRPDLQLAPEVDEERAVADLSDRDTGQLRDSVPDVVGVLGVGSVAGDVHDDVVGVALHDIERGECPAGPGDRLRQQSRRVGRRRCLDPDGDGVAGAGTAHASRS
jgi:hypothetical protein